MKIQVNAEYLRQAIAKVSAFGEDSSVEISALNNAVCLRSLYRNGALIEQQVTDAKIEETGTILVQMDRLKLVAAGFAGIIRLDGEESRLVVKGKKSFLYLNKVINKIIPPFPDVEKAYELNAEELVDALAVQSKLPSRFTGMTALTGVCLEEVAGKINVISTDGAALFVSTVETELLSNTSESRCVDDRVLILPCGFLSSLSRVVDTEHAISLSRTDDKAVFEQNGLKAMCVGLTGRYPKWQPLLEISKEVVVECKYSEMRAILAFAKKFYGTKFGPVRIETGDNLLSVQLETETDRYSDSVILHNENAPTIFGHFDVKYTKWFTNLSDSDLKITLSVGNKGRVKDKIKFQCDNRLAVIMCLTGSKYN